MNYLATLPFASALLVAQAQIPAPPMAAVQAETSPEARPDTMVHRTIRTLNYRLIKGSTRIEFQSATLHREAGGEAKIKTKNGATLIKATFANLPVPSTYGEANLTYVLWAVTPEGQSANLGELQVKNGKAKIKVTEQLPAFGLIVTAEPHYAVTQPSDALVLENAVGKKTQEQVEMVEAKLQMMPQDGYVRCLTAAGAPVGAGQGPAEVMQARRAVMIAQGAGAAKDARDVLDKAQTFLHQSESTEAGEKDRIMTARSATASAEEARILAMRGRVAEIEARGRMLAQARIEQAKEEAAKAAAAKDEALKQASLAAQESEGLRTRLMAELSGILETKATARGLIVSMSGVLFKTGQSTLLPAAREKLAKVAGILATHKGIQIQAEGFTDSTGSPQFNEKLSQERAMAARDFLVSQGVPAEAIRSKGYGPEHPIADNGTETGRQENRRVELVVSGEGIDTPAEKAEPAEPAQP